MPGLRPRAPTVLGGSRAVPALGEPQSPEGPQGRRPRKPFVRAPPARCPLVAGLLLEPSPGPGARVPEEHRPRLGRLPKPEIPVRGGSRARTRERYPIIHTPQPLSFGEAESPSRLGPPGLPTTRRPGLRAPPPAPGPPRRLAAPRGRQAGRQGRAGGRARGPGSASGPAAREAAARVRPLSPAARRPAYLALRRSSSSNCRAEPTSTTAAAASAAPAAMLQPPDKSNRARAAGGGGASGGCARKPRPRARPRPAPVASAEPRAGLPG